MTYERIDYGDTWNERREYAKERDGYQCRICGKNDSIKNPLHVHHVTKVKEFDDPDDAHGDDNIITLCKTHHRLVETGRIQCPEPEAIDRPDIGNVLEY